MHLVDSWMDGALCYVSFGVDVCMPGWLVGFNVVSPFCSVPVNQLVAKLEHHEKGCSSNQLISRSCILQGHLLEVKMLGLSAPMEQNRTTKVGNQSIF